MSRLIAMNMISDGELRVLFDDSGAGDHTTIQILMTSGKGKEAIKDIVDAINSNQKIVVLADEFTGESIINDYEGGNVTVSSGSTGAFALNGNLSVAGDTTLSGKFAGHRRLVIRQADFTANARTLTVAESGALVLLDTDAATAVTLPAITASDIGVTYTVMQTISSEADRVVNTAYDNDFYTGAVVLLPSDPWASGAAQDGLDIFCRTAGSDGQITFDDAKPDAAGNVGSSITVTAILTGNVEAGGGSKYVWSVTGAMATADPDSSGGSVFSNIN